MTYTEDSEEFDELERRIKEEKEYSRKKPGTVLICPQCGSMNVTYFMGLKTGVLYQCKDCDYVGAFIIERDMDQL